MPDNKEYITTDEFEMRDPLIDPPPRNKDMLLINEGGRLVQGKWYKGAWAWCPKPKIPASVKERMLKAATGGGR